MRQWTTEDEIVEEGLEAVATTPRQDTTSTNGIGDVTVDSPACDCATCKYSAIINSPVSYADKSKHVSSLPVHCIYDVVILTRQVCTCFIRMLVSLQLASKITNIMYIKHQFCWTDLGAVTANRSRRLVCV